MEYRGDLLFRGRRCDSGGGESGTVLSRLINRKLSSTVMAALARSTAGNQLALGLVEADQLDAVGGAVLCPEGGAVEADTGLHADQVGPEAGGEGPLHEKHVGSVEGGGGYLSVGSLIDASRIDDLALIGVLVIVHGSLVNARRAQLTIVAEGQALVSGNATILFEHKGISSPLDSSCRCRVRVASGGSPRGSPSRSPSSRTGTGTNSCSCGGSLTLSALLASLQTGRRRSRGEDGDDEREPHFDW